MSSLIIENGTGVENANSYADVEFLSSYADARGFAIPTSNEDRERFLIIAFDYLQCRLADHGCTFTDIPKNLKFAQAQLVVEQQRGTRLWPKPITSSVEGFVTEKTIGPLTKKFQAGSNSNNGVFGGRADPKEPVCIASVEMFLKSVLSSDSCNGGSCCNHKETLRA